MTFKILNTFILILAKLLIGLNFSFANDIKLPSIVVGEKNASIVIKEYFSLTCSHCASFHKNTYPKVKKELIDTGKVKFEFIDYPLDRLAMFAASIARSIPSESYVETTSLLLSNQKKWAYSKDPVTELLKLSKLFGISEKKFNEILNNKELMEKILKKMEEENSRFNISSTPTFVINDKHVIAGSLKYNEFVKKLKDFELLN